MKSFQLAVFASLVVGSIAAHAGEPVIHISVGGEISPGVYGQVDFGNAPPPPLVYSKPRIIEVQHRGMEMEPIYLHVPPGHAKKWSKHCREYNACNREVYFVKSEEYEPGYRRHNGNHHGDDEHEGDDRGHGHGHKGGDHRG
jgi:hypothetical protein